MYTIALTPVGHTIACGPEDTVLAAILGSGVSVAFGCRGGGCGACKMQLVSGHVEHGRCSVAVLPEEERASGLFLSCQARPLEDIIKSGKFHPSIEKRLLDRQAEPPLDQNPRCAQVAKNMQQMREAVQKVMDDHTLDALVYPSWAFPPRMIGDLNTPHGNNSPRLSPPTGFPAITVPMGFVRDGLPVGLQVLGRAWSEPTLIKIVYGYEQATRHRRPPASTLPLPARP